jgi:hypothetical protein
VQADRQQRALRIVGLGLSEAVQTSSRMATAIFQLREQEASALSTRMGLSVL